MNSFSVTYRITLDENENIDDKVRGICLEQSVELPGEVIPADLEKRIVGSPRPTTRTAENTCRVEIEWPVDNIGDDITQLINILYGNISLKKGIQVTGIEWSALPASLLNGPKAGLDTLRSRYKIRDRPLGSTALKPMGLTPEELGEICYKFAAGGIDIIKDDHGLTNQSYAPFKARINHCVHAIRQAADETGNRARYFPNITSDYSRLKERYEQAAEAGADGVMLCPHITGWSALSYLARMDIDLPLIAHPAFGGALFTDTRRGFAPSLLLGEVWRAFGADMVIYPNTGGRFHFSLEQCAAINAALRNYDLPFKRTFPMVGGGINLENLSEWYKQYGKDTVFLIGSSLYQHPEGIQSAARQFRNTLE